MASGTWTQVRTWKVYIVRCSDGSLYTGVTTDLVKRVGTHNNGTGAKYTRSRRPVTLAYWESQMDHSHALKREAAVKKMSRQGKLEMIRACAS